MLRYPIDIKQVSSEVCRAVWVDFPDLPQGQGRTMAEAMESLVGKSFSLVADLVARGLHPTPTPEEGRPAVAFSIPQALSPPHQAGLLSVTRHGTMMATYSLTNDFTYVE